MRRRKGRGSAIAATGAALCAAALALSAWLVFQRTTAAFPNPSPRLHVEDALASTEKEPGSSDEAGSAVDVNWDYWRTINPAIVGWVSIPGTSVSQPIVQAPENDPGKYLNTDVHGNWNAWGAVYLDAACANGLVGSSNAIVYGHHTRDGSMFSELARYADAVWAREHADIVIQTPAGSHRYRVRFVSVLDGDKQRERTSFASASAFETWYVDELKNADVVIDAATRPQQTISLVTCSYHRFENERTVVVCSEAP